ncbi:MAG: hypothetical protein AABW46_04630 [Nanoarchaeota archaeon]
MPEQFGQFGVELERRMQDRRLKEYRNKRNEILRGISNCESNLLEIKKEINKVQKDYEENRITYEEYLQRITGKYNGRTLSQWEDYKESLHRLHEEHTASYHRETSLILPFVFIVLFGLGLLFLGSSMQGLVGITGEVASDIYSFGVPEETMETTTSTTTTTIESDQLTTIGQDNKAEIITKTSDEVFGIQAPAKIIDDSFSCNPSTIEIGEFTNCTGQYDDSGDSFTTVCDLYLNAGSFLTNSCGSNNLKVVAVDVSLANSANCVDNNNGSTSCTNWPNTADNQVINWTIEGCSSTAGVSVSTITGCSSTLNSLATVVVATTTTSTTSTTSTTTTLTKSYFPLYLTNSTGVAILNDNLTAETNETINITSSELTPADANVTLFITGYDGVNSSYNYSSSFIENFTTFWTIGDFLINVSWEGNLSHDYNSTAFYVTVLSTTTTSTTTTTTTTTTTLTKSYFPLYLTNSTGVAILNDNLTAETNETINITSSELTPADANVTLFIDDYSLTFFNANYSMSYLENFTNFWKEGSYRINISWEGNLSHDYNSTTFYVEVITTTTTTTSTTSTTLAILTNAYFPLYLNESFNSNITTQINESINITSSGLTPEDANITLFVDGANYNISQGFLENFTTLVTSGSFLVNVTWEGNSSYNGNSTAFYVDVSPNVAPVIEELAIIDTQTITEQGQTFVTFHFNVSDANGLGNIDSGSAKAQFNSSDSSELRVNESCNQYEINSTVMMFECIVDIWYWDAGPLGYNVSIEDNLSAYTEDTDQTFTIAQTKAMDMNPTALTFPTVTLGATDQASSNDPIEINNSGNVVIAAGNMNITAFDLHGLTTLTESIDASNFTVNNTDSCAGSTGGILMQNNTKTILTPNSMDAGNVSAGGTVNTTLYFCLFSVPSSGISGQVYDTSGTQNWEIGVF